MSTKTRLLGRFRLHELESQDAKGLVKLARKLTLEPDSEILRKTDTYLAWERKGQYAATYSLKKLRTHVDYQMK